MISIGRFPLEMHLVHVEPATGKIAVIGWLFTLGADSPFLAQVYGRHSDGFP